jgi:hypothetical protein
MQGRSRIRLLAASRPQSRRDFLRGGVAAGPFAIADWPAVDDAAGGPRNASATSNVPAAETGEWRAHGRDAGGMRHASLTQIHRDNVGDLAVAWTNHAGSSSPTSAPTSPIRRPSRPPAFGRSPPDVPTILPNLLERVNQSAAKR